MYFTNLSIKHVIMLFVKLKKSLYIIPNHRPCFKQILTKMFFVFFVNPTRIAIFGKSESFCIESASA